MTDLSDTRAGLPGRARMLVRRLLSVGTSLRERSIRGSVAVMAGEAYANLARLAANLIMTRLLYPEAFGLMLIVNLVAQIAGQLSDVGVQQAIIAKRGKIEDRFLDTAWTMFVVRGIVLTIVLLLVAYPVSLIYEEKQLLPLLLLVSIVPLIRSVASPHPILYERNVKPTRYVIVTIFSVTGSLVLTIAWLLIHPTIWALAANGIFAAVITTTLTYVLFPGRRPRLCWDKEIVLEIFRFGRWIFLGTGLSFLATQGDQIIISNWVPAVTLGLFSIAVNLSRLPQAFLGKLTYGVLLATYAEIRSEGAGNVAKELRRIKLSIYGLSLPIVLLLSVFGQELVELLYDDRYHEAGWMLQILALGTIFFAAGSALHAIPLSYGDSYRHMWRQVFSVATLTLSMVLGGLLAGFPGLLIGSVIAQALDFLIIKIAIRKYGIKDYRTDTVFIGLSLAVVFVIWAFRGWPSDGAL